jgi:hypothetical protein
VTVAFSLRCLARRCGHFSVVLSVALLPAIVAPCTAADHKVYSICDLAANAKSLQNTEVRVKAIYMTDQLEFSGLTDPTCPGLVMDLSFDTASLRKKQRSVKAFDLAIQGDASDLRLRKFEVEFTGTFRWDFDTKARETHNGLETPRGNFDLKRIWTFARWPT